MTKKEFARYIEQADFNTLFAELGWDENRERYAPVAIKTADGKPLSFAITPVAMQAGFRVLTCAPLPNGDMPDRTTRQRIATGLHKRYPEHLLIFTDAKKTPQVWNVVLKRKDQPLRHSAVRWSKGQDVEALWQRIFRLAFTVREAEDGITILKVAARIESGFAQNADPVVKKFYTAFSKQHKDFYAFVKGIDDHIDALNKKAKKDSDKQENRNKQWYVSLMLNRLMFCYFIQKKSFLNRDPDYLRNKLKESKTRKGKNKFYSFYRDFLLHLFHEGLGNPKHNKELQEMIGRIPYLNGGLFDVHELEEQFDEIQIDDEAFDNIFAFFDQWHWHLDTSDHATGKDINPDVIGYIFERYINERAKMGAYYTKEDITEYISRNCILPWLWEETERRMRGKKTREGEGNTSLAEFVKASGDNYIYPAVKHGFEETLPADIEAGIKEVIKRTGWNKPAPAAHGLPTEIWREVVARRQRYDYLMAKIRKGEVASITDFITYNLDVRQAVQDYIAQCSDPGWLRAFWESLKEMTVLDPTCGSGAFLFAAMNILEPLYEGCLDGMAGFIEDEDRENAADKARFHNRYKDFRAVLDDIKNPEKHPSRKYYIFKSIILRNLYGVDIMKEAVEIAKLRLFLKLVGCVDVDFSKDSLGLEPLPDVDFNVRAGNTLVGFATRLQLVNGSLNFQTNEKAVSDLMDKVSDLYKHFKEMQLAGTENFETIKKGKADYQEELKKLREELDRSYYGSYHQGSASNKEHLDAWKESHQPFHWFAEFYGIVHGRAGFDVVIGNPPYVVYTKKDSKTKKSVADSYSLKGYKTISSNNLYAFCIERSSLIISSSSYLGMIIPISSVSSDGFGTLQQIFSSGYFTYQSSYSNRPAKLFEDVEQRLTIVIARRMENRNRAYASTAYKHWYSSTRKYLFSQLSYQVSNRINSEISFCKVGAQIERVVLNKLLTNASKPLAFYKRTLGGSTFFHNGPTYFIRAMSFRPNSGKNMQASSHYKEYVVEKSFVSAATCILNSSIFYFFFKNYSNCRDFSSREIDAFPVGDLATDIVEELTALEKGLKLSYRANKEIKSREYDSGLIYYEEYYPSLSKPIVDEIDRVLARHYGFTEEELDFIINYDIKYRMGLSGAAEEEQDDVESMQRPNKIKSTTTFTPQPFTTMREFTHDEGIYTVKDVMDITGISRSKVKRWFTELSNLNYEGISLVQQGAEKELCISFYGLVELVVINHLREEKFQLANIWKARKDLGRRTGKIYPFATNNVKERMKITGQDLVFQFNDGEPPVTLDGKGRRSGQFNMDFIQDFFRNMDFSEDGLVVRFYPYQNSRLIVVDPKQGGGKATISGKGTWAETIAGFYKGPESVPGLMRDYGLTEEEVSIAVEYWN